MTPQIILVLVIIVVSLVLFALELFPTDVIALGIVVTLVLTGLLTTKDAFAGFGSDAVLMILGMLIMAAALMRTGVVDLVGRLIFRLTGNQPKRILAVEMVTASALSSFMSNAATTAFFLPIVLSLANRVKVSPAKYLMPLAFATILASSVTLIATSTNIIVSELMTQYGLAPLGVFEMTPVGLPIVIVGLLYMYFIGSRLIPDRFPATPIRQEFARHLYLTEMIIPPNSPFVGKRLGDTVLGSELQIQVLRIMRGLHQHVIPQADIVLEAGDVLLVECERSEIIKIKALPGVNLRDDEDWIEEAQESGEIAVVEVILLPGSPFIGRTLRGLRPRERYSLQVLAISRRGELVRQELNTIRMRLGDVLLIQSSRSNISVLDQQLAFRILGEAPPDEQPDLRRAPRAVAIFAGVLVLASLNLVALPVAALGGAVLAFATRCITPEEAYRLVEWKVLILIGSMLALGKALESTGAAVFLAQQIVSVVGTASPVVVLGAFFLLTVALTPLSHSAAAIVVLPVAIRSAQQLGLDPRPFVIMIAVAATNGYLTPLDQVCVMVYGPGHYRFTDFLRVGALLTVIIFGLALLLVPLLWPLR